MVNLADVIAVLYPAAIPITDYAVGDQGNGPQLVYWNTAKLGVQPTAAQLAAVTPAQVTAAQQAAQRAPAQAALSATNPQGALFRAVVLALMDQINTLRAALPTPLPPITPAQARAAVLAKLTNGAADS